MPLDLDAISKVVENSALARNTNWEDRGPAPIGYYKGMAIMFAVMQQKLAEGDPVAVDVSRAATTDSEHDALAWYTIQFHLLNMLNDTDGIDTLRHLFVLMIGLGMRESSGRYCEGRDQSASNTSADTAEAGLFQQSWNSNTSIPLLHPLMEDYMRLGGDDGYKAVFSEGVNCTPADFANYGEGAGAEFQRLCKEEPGFAVEAAALCLRHRRDHFGPINRKEAHLLAKADNMLREVQELDHTVPIPVPEFDTEWVQRTLNTLGARPPLDEDGIFGSATRSMLTRFQSENSLPTTGAPDPQTLEELKQHLDQLDDELAPSVTWAQWALNILGAKPKLDEDGEVGPATTAMVRRFQQENDLLADGELGPDTYAEIARHLQPPKAATPALVTSGWSPKTLYEYGDIQPAWYANFDFEEGLVPGVTKESILGANNENADILSDTNRQYGETAIKPNSVGWNKWIDAQIARAAKAGDYIEFDNADYALERNREEVRVAYHKANAVGLRALLKNPTKRDITEFAPLAAGAVFEDGAMWPAEFALARRAVAPTLQATWVRFGKDQAAEVKELVRQIATIPGTSVQLGTSEYHGMKLMGYTPLARN